MLKWVLWIKLTRILADIRFQAAAAATFSRILPTFKDQFNYGAMLFLHTGTSKLTSIEE